MVRLRTLTPSIEVRILAGHPLARRRARCSVLATASRQPSISVRADRRPSPVRTGRVGARSRASASRSAHTPAASPAKKAAPSAVVSRLCGRSTGTWRMSARNWHSQALAAIPPSIRSAWRVPRRPAPSPRSGRGSDRRPPPARRGRDARRSVERQAENRPSRIGVPIGRAEADERRDQIDAVAVGDARRQAVGLGRVGDHAEPVAQPFAPPPRRRRSSLRARRSSRRRGDRRAWSAADAATSPALAPVLISMKQPVP